MVVGRIVENIVVMKEMMKMANKVVVDKLLFLMQEELKNRKAVRSILKERITHEDFLIIDLEKKILDYINSDKDKEKHIKEHIN